MSLLLPKTPAVELSPQQRREYLAFAESAASQAGAATLQYFRTPLDVANKLGDGRFDPVTEGDKTAERIIRELVQAKYPEHGIYGEEFGAATGNGLTWVVDPIDGTRAFMTGMVHWGVLLALFDGQRPVVGVMVQPFTGEVFASDGVRSTYHRQDQNAQVLQTSGVTTLDKAVLGSTGPHLYATPEELAQFTRLQDKVKMTRFGGDCYIYAMLAMGYVDVAADPGLSAYDIQALMPIIEAAGGVVTTWGGGDASMGGAVVASATPRLHEQVLQRLQSN